MTADQAAVIEEIVAGEVEEIEQEDLDDTDEVTSTATSAPAGTTSAKAAKAKIENLEAKKVGFTKFVEKGQFFASQIRLYFDDTDLTTLQPSRRPASPSSEQLRRRNSSVSDTRMDPLSSRKSPNSTSKDSRILDSATKRGCRRRV